jgi:hypothetical protein
MTIDTDRLAALARAYRRATDDYEARIATAAAELFGLLEAIGLTTRSRSIEVDGWAYWAEEVAPGARRIGMESATAPPADAARGGMGEGVGRG